jgi:hypothetical protein
VAAGKTPSVIVSTYPWVNGKTEDEIERFLGHEQAKSPQRAGLKTLVNKTLQRFGFEIRRVAHAPNERTTPP